MNDYNKKVNATIAKFMKPFGYIYTSPEHCQFGSSWDWLMPVIHKLWDNPTSPGPMYDEKTNKVDKPNEDVKLTTSIKSFMLYGSLQQCSWAVADLIIWSETLK